MASAQFTIEGVTCPAAVDVGGAGVTVDLAVLSVEGLVSTTFRVANNETALSSELSSAPTISNYSRGKAQFTFPSGWDTNIGAAIGIECVASDQYGQTYTAYGIAGVANALGFIPAVANEEYWRDASTGWREVLDSLTEQVIDLLSQTGTYSLDRGNVQGSLVELTSGATSYTTVLTVPLATWLPTNGRIVHMKVKAGYGEDAGTAYSQDEDEIWFRVMRTSASSWTLKLPPSTVSGPSATPSLSGTVGTESVGWQVTISGTDLLFQMQRDISVTRNAKATCTVEYPGYYL